MGGFFILMTSLFFLSSTAQAENFRFSLNAFYDSKKEDSSINGSSATAEVKHINMDFLLGYIFSNQMYGGVLYASDTTETAVSATVTRKELINHMGLSVGYIPGSWYFIGHYLLNGTYIPADNQKWSDQTGMQLDVGYAFATSDTFRIGLQMTYRKLDYKVYEASGTKVPSSSHSQTAISPKVALSFFF